MAKFLNGLTASDVCSLAEARQLPFLEATLNEKRVEYGEWLRSFEVMENDGSREYAELVLQYRRWKYELTKLEEQVNFAYACAKYVAESPHLEKYRR